MLDLKYAAQHRAQVIDNLSARGLQEAPRLVAQLLDANRARKEAQKKSDDLASQLHRQSKVLASLLTTDPERAHAQKKELRLLKEAHKKELASLKSAQEEVAALLGQLPNLSYEEVPVGDKTKNKLLKRVDAPPPPQMGASLQPHWALATRYGLIDFEKGSKIMGTGFPVYMGKGAQLQRALVRFFLDQAARQGYQEVQPPLLVNEASTWGTGQSPDKEGMMYKLENSATYLIPTAEVPLTNLYRDALLPADALPQRLVAYTPCFRREAGAAGAQVRGLNRLHQFDKVELVEIHIPATARKALEQMVNYVAGLLEQLQLTYRILQLATQELGFAAAMTYDLEVWSPGQKKWLEVSSISSFDTYQARRLHLRYREGAQNRHCHTLNGSALALPRVVAALLEQYQTPSTIRVPDVLVPYTQWETLS